MKRFWLVMLSLGLVLAFSASALAVDVKFSGSFYAAGMYQDTLTFIKDSESDHSTAFYYQRLRLQTDFIVSPGLKLVTRFDAMERIWGGARSDQDLDGSSYFNPGDSQSVNTRFENENIAFDWAYVSYASPIGLIEVGYMADNGWGTVFGNNAVNGASIGKINYLLPIGPLYLSATMSKSVDRSSSAITSTVHTDQDVDSYSVAAIYVVNKDIQVGLLGGYKRVAAAKHNGFEAPPNFLGGLTGFAQAYTVNPYVKAKFGPVAVEAELNYAYGKIEATDSYIGYPDIDIRDLTAYVNAVADFGMFYAGGTFAYVSGDDGLTVKNEGGFIDGGVDFNPTLIMFNTERSYWAGNITGWNPVNKMGAPMTNAWFGQGKVGIRPIAALDIVGSVSYAQADKDWIPAGAWPTTIPVWDKDYGWEVDVTGTYKITNNLSYMLGFGYLFTGDYYKYTSSIDPEDNFIVINKLTLTF